MRLANKIGIVTAAGSGMGRAGAIRFAAEGAAVAVVDLNEQATDAVVRQITAAGGTALGLSGDLTRDDFARDIVRQTTRHFGGLDFVWNHVGTPGPASIEGLDWKDFDLAINLNLVVSREQILQRVWGDAFEGQSNIVDVYVSAIRRKLVAAGGRKRILTVWGVGYKLIE